MGMGEATADDAGAPALSEAKRKEFGRLDAERMAAIEALEMQLGAAQGENRGIKTVAAAFSVVPIAVLSVGRDSRDRGVGSDPFCPAGVEWDQAGALIDQRATFRGEIVSTIHMDNSASQPTFLNVGRPLPDPSRLAVVVWGRDRGRFSRPPEVAYSAGQEICVSGEVGMFEGVAQIEINSPSAVSVR